ncbi:hypothetical protein GH714_001264 [Hevea brasiliensis]|uniref:Uncharacterized protein n=1 Tax=Hevea brasiliensis TaxID=3981 RepID=A0A6A6KGL6_HEVBR|nr:hypothetical protein GH714_001264 [Hevea brasiliensis]
MRGYVLVACDANTKKPEVGHLRQSKSGFPALKQPLNYSLIWSTNSHDDGSGYFWLPNPPAGYKAMGVVVTNKPEEPSVEEVRCVRADLTEKCETCDLIISSDSKTFKNQFQIWNTRPCKRGMFERCSCWDILLCAVVLQKWRLLCQEGKDEGEWIEYRGSNLPSGGENDGEYWIDLPNDDDARNNIKRGDLESAELYVHVKPVLGGTFTDLQCGYFVPSMDPTLKVGLMSIPMTKIGQHVGDWEHFTLRISNFTGELWQVLLRAQWWPMGGCF